MASSKMVDVKNVVSNNNIYRDKNNFLSLSLYVVHCTSYDEYIVSCFLIKCFWWRSGRERLSRALADIPLAVVLLGLTRSLSNANIVANTAYQKHDHKYCFNCSMFPS